MKKARAVNQGRLVGRVFTTGLKMPCGTYVRPGSRIQRVVLGMKGLAIMTIVCAPKKPRLPHETKVFSVSRDAYDRITSDFGIHTMEVN